MAASDTPSTGPPKRLTRQQRHVVDVAATGRNLCVVARAGCGKTSTLVDVAASRPTAQWTFLAFNRAIAADARSKLPRGVRSTTLHALALREGTLASPGMRRKWESSGGTFGPNEWAAMADLDTHDHNFRAHVRTIRATYARFCASADDRPHPRHVPENVAAVWRRELGPDRAQERIRWTVVRVARAWDRIVDPTHDAGIDHDGSLKAFAASGRPWAGDGVLVDEAQDLAPVVVAMVAGLTVQRIVVGDPAQRIYAWRGAVDAMAALPDRSVPLDRSFRFGPAVAGVARSVLQVLDPAAHLSGHGPADRVTDEPLPQTARKAVLCRTNAGVVEAVLAHDTRRVALADGGGLAIRDLERAYGLWLGRDDRRGGSAWTAFASVAEEHGGQERTLLRIVERYGHQVPALVRTLAKAARTDEDDADVVVTTIHRSKGREWDTVELWGDLARIPTSRRALYRDPDRDGAEAELRLAYVAVTRARSLLSIERLDDDLRASWSTAAART